MHSLTKKLRFCLIQTLVNLFNKYLPLDRNSNATDTTDCIKANH